MPGLVVERGEGDGIGKAATRLLWSERAALAPSVIEAELLKVSVAQYEGGYAADGLFEGEGKATFVTGHTYEGCFLRGQLHGKGRYIWSDGIVYTGDFADNSITGTGVWEWPSGARYEGQVLGGLRHGLGRMSFSGSEVVYSGSWRKAKRHGQGRLVFNAAETCFYDGAWKDDVKHGQGSMQYQDGSMYSGGWAHDLKEGHGTMRWAGGREQYVGRWAGGLQNGPGEHVWLQALPTRQNPSKNHAFFVMFNRYSGMFKDGKRHGWGVLHYATGARYEGEWQCEKKHGQGCFCFEDGSVFQGQFSDDQAVPTNEQAFGATGTGVQLSIGDLLSQEADAEAAAKSIANLLLCHNLELRSIYDRYSALSSPAAGQSASDPRQQRHVFTLRNAQFWQLMRDCAIPEPALPLARINTLTQQARTLPAALLSLRERLAPAEVYEVLQMEQHAVHSQQADLLFHQLCEALVRIAHCKYHSLPSLARRIQRLLQQDVLSRAGKVKPDPFQQQLGFEDNAALVTQLAQQVAAAFQQACFAAPRSLESSGRSSATPVPDLLPSSPPDLSLFDLDVPCTFQCFVDGTVRCAEHMKDGVPEDEAALPRKLSALLDCLAGTPGDATGQL
ncbi:hypothetical protein WJX72_005878 [[Myrmecia] bisecta]|uniref:Uncharacterized protein n=1 Tax=[Myrmecia] bisecta TaxID=41462 RepID=A0AAW1QQX0_9CHLO